MAGRESIQKKDLIQMTEFKRVWDKFSELIGEKKDGPDKLSWTADTTRNILQFLSGSK